MGLLHRHLPSFEEPVEMLGACHDNVRRFSRLLVALAERLEQGPVGPETAQMAADILRYFADAAPHHHADEEQDLFPRLRELGDAALNAILDRLLEEHRHMAALWARLQPILQTLAAMRAARLSRQEAQAFADLYQQHAREEDEVVYPHARHLAGELLQAIGRRMAERRGVH